MKKLTHNLLFEFGSLKVKVTGTSLIEDVEPPKPKPDNKPTSPQAMWVASLFRRSPQTAWTDKEIGSYVKHRALLTPENMQKLQAYHQREEKKGEAGNHRRDLGTFLNNLPGELDRANLPQINGSHRHSTPESPRNAGTLNEGRSAQYAQAAKRPAP